jgi:PTH1 family peptidyl-tRNA hydrolase
MSWLQKRPQASDSIQFYSTSLTKTKLLIGLGNPGKEYDGTRHNIGFACLDYFVAASDDMGSWIAKKDMKCIESTGRFGDARVIAIKPTTFMNLSGEAVQAVAAFYKIAPENMIVLHDELDIDFGQIRIRSGGSSAGHNGLNSIIEHLGEDFGRIRIGIGPKKPARMSGANFVLQAFNETERVQLPNLYRETAAIITENIYSEQLHNETRSFLV